MSRAPSMRAKCTQSELESGTWNVIAASRDVEAPVEGEQENKFRKSTSGPRPYVPDACLSPHRSSSVMTITPSPQTSTISMTSTAVTAHASTLSLEPMQSLAVADERTGRSSAHAPPPFPGCTISTAR
eukprot:1445890-Prymnesium_polylepis.1